MREGTASRTAIWVSFWRGLGGFDRAVKTVDPIAEHLLPAPHRAALRAAERAPRVASVVMAGLGVASGGLSRHLPFRTRAIDEAISRAVADGVTQTVILGAGLDARAYRLDALAGSTVYEVDHPDTQAHKRRGAEGLSIRAKELVYVAVDFATDDLATELRKAGHDPTRPTVFIWEGVTMYLPHEAIHATLTTLAARAAKGSCLLMTYYDERAMLSERLAHPIFAIVGEPLKSRFTPAAARAILGDHGFSVMSDEGDAEWGLKYVGWPGFARISERLVCAEKK